jgi:ribosomal protein L37AE/L43A
METTGTCQLDLSISDTAAEKRKRDEVEIIQTPPVGGSASVIPILKKPAVMKAVSAPPLASAVCYTCGSSDILEKKFHGVNICGKCDWERHGKYESMTQMKVKKFYGLSKATIDAMPRRNGVFMGNRVYIFAKKTVESAFRAEHDQSRIDLRVLLFRKKYFS